MPSGSRPLKPKPHPSHSEDDRSQDPVHQGAGPRPLQRQQTIPLPPRREKFERPSERTKEVTGQYFQLLSGHASTRSYLAEGIEAAQSSACWQSRFHRCRVWPAQSGGMWRGVEKACGWKHPRAPSVRRLFDRGRAAPTVLAILRGTEIGRMVTPGSPKGEGREGIELFPQEETGGGRG